MTTTATQLPVGTWVTDPVHSSLDFSVKHMVVATYRGSLPTFTATLTVAEDGTGTLRGTGDLTSVVTDDPNLTGHLQSPDFFDTEQYPEVSFASTSVTRDGENLTVVGDLALKGVTKPIELTGSIAGPAVTLGDVQKIGIELTGTFDRTEFGLNWNAPLPGGGFAVGNTVALAAHLELAAS
ncbi:MAG: YceI family protein [Thermoleophilia bacterium]